MKKLLTALAAATLMTAPIVAAPVEAAAQARHGGFHGGGFRGGGYHGGGYWRGGRWFGPAVGLGLGLGYYGAYGACGHWVWSPYYGRYVWADYC